MLIHEVQMLKQMEQNSTLVNHCEGYLGALCTVLAALL